jgi:hypothetical protein
MLVCGILLTRLAGKPPTCNGKVEHLFHFLSFLPIDSIAQSLQRKVDWLKIHSTNELVGLDGVKPLPTVVQRLSMGAIPNSCILRLMRIGQARGAAPTEFPSGHALLLLKHV